MCRRDIENKKENMQRERKREKINSTIILVLKPVYCINGPNR